MVRIGINARTFSVSEPGGEVQSMIKLFSKLIEISSNEFEFIIFGNEKVKSIFPDNEIISNGFFVNSQIFGLIWEQTMLRLLVKKFDIDILLFPSANGFFIKSNNVRSIVWIHDMNAFYEWMNPHYRLLTRIRHPSVAKSADVIVTVSNFSKGEIQRLLNIPESKIKVVYNGVDEYFFSNTRKDSCKFDYPEMYILFVGSAIPRKNIERLILAYRRIKDKIDEYLVIIGPKNKRVFGNVNLEDDEKIIIKGFVSKEELKYTYENASLFVFPSLYEGFGLPPLEAMACGTPVVASNVSSLPEVLGDAAHYVDPYSVDDIATGMLKVLDDNSYRKELIRRGLKQVKRYTWKKAAEDVLDIIRDLLLF